MDLLPRALLAAWLGMSVGSPIWGAVPQEPADGARATVLVTTYADGRTVHHIVTGTPGSSWTPMFPRVPGASPSKGRPQVSAIKYKRVLGADGRVAVQVSVLHGRTHDREEPVGEVSVGAGERVAVDALTAFGVAPVVFSLTPLSPTTLLPPRVLNRTAGLEVADIEVLTDPSPRYRITVRNLSTQPAVTFHVATYRGERPTLSGTRGNKDASPIVEAGGTYSFAWAPASGTPGRGGGWTPASHDQLEIAAVLWEDGTVEGEAERIAPVLLLYQGRRAQLIRGVALLKTVGDEEHPRQAKTRLVARLEQLAIEPDADVRAAARARLEAVSTLEDVRMDAVLGTALANSRQGMLDDVKAAPEDPAAFARWRVEIVGLYEQWIDRFTRR